MSTVNEAAEAWKKYFEESDFSWQQLINSTELKQSGCGPIYVFDNPINRPNETVAIADMRDLKITEPHYHPEETEIYIILSGSGMIVIGGEEQQITQGDVIVTPPDTAHFTIPKSELVLAAINIPAFKPENYVILNESNEEVGFDRLQFEKLAT